MTMNPRQSPAPRTIAICLVTVAWALAGPAHAQTSSWSSRVEAGRVTMPPSPPGTHVIPQPTSRCSP